MTIGSLLSRQKSTSISLKKSYFQRGCLKITQNKSRSKHLDDIIKTLHPKVTVGSVSSMSKTYFTIFG